MKHSTVTSRFAALVFALVLVAPFGLAVAVAPMRVHAQEPAPAVQPSAGSNAAAAQSNVPGKETKQEENSIVYRHTPIVKALARKFNMDVETTARIFEFINFAILFFAIVIPLLRFMPRLFRKRSENLRHDLESARKLTADANARMSAVEARLTRLDEEIAGIRSQVEAEAKNDEIRIKSTIDEERERIVASAEQEIAAAAAHAKRGLRHFAADLAIEQAARQLVLTPETDRALIAEFVSDSSRGGKN